MPQLKNKADWTAIILHYILGAIIGAAVACVLIFRGSDIFDLGIQGEVATMFIIGGKLIGGCIGSLQGDRLWMRNYKVITPLGVAHSKTSKSIMMTGVVIGGMCILGALLKHFTS